MFFFTYFYCFSYCRNSVFVIPREIETIKSVFIFFQEPHNRSNEWLTLFCYSKLWNKQN